MAGTFPGPEVGGEVGGEVGVVDAQHVGGGVGHHHLHLPHQVPGLEGVLADEAGGMAGGRWQVAGGSVALQQALTTIHSAMLQL